MSIVNRKRIDEFWSWFLQKAPSIKAIMKIPDTKERVKRILASREEIDAWLAKVSPGIASAFHPDDKDSMVIEISARYDPVYMGVAEEVADNAPKIPGWFVDAYELPYPMDFMMEIPWESGDFLTIRDFWCRITRIKWNEPVCLEMSLPSSATTISVPGFGAKLEEGYAGRGVFSKLVFSGTPGPAGEKDCLAATKMVLGEELFLLAIKKVVVVPVEGHPALNGFFRLLDLPDVLRDLFPHEFVGTPKQRRARRRIAREILEK